MANHYVCCRAAGRLRHVSSKHDFDLLSLLLDTSERVLLWAPFWCKYISHGQTLISAITIDNSTINHRRAPFHPERELSRSHSRTQWGGVAHTREREWKKGIKREWMRHLVRGAGRQYFVPLGSHLSYKDKRYRNKRDAIMASGRYHLPCFVIHNSWIKEGRDLCRSDFLGQYIMCARRTFIYNADDSHLLARTPFFSPWCRADVGNARAPYSH